VKINIVCRNWEDDRVLPRFARYLSIANGWSLSKVVDESADLNYYMAYFEILKNKEYVGKMAAFFTHYEKGTGKATWYDRVAEMADLRIGMNQGQLRHLKSFGGSLILPLPVEGDRFTLRSGKSKKRPVVGFSGFTYKSGRKGEALAAGLMEEFGPRIDFKASGRGWPCSTTGYSWRDLPNFFKSLDVFVCTSSLEGGPMTTLEALSTGVPVVIPAEVGIHPQLPYIPGIYRYMVGNKDSLAVALEQALGELDTITRESLRAAVADNTVENFCVQHKSAIERVLRPPKPEKPIKDWKANSGIYVVAFGAPARKCANRCIRACKRQMPDIPIALCATEPLDAGEDIFIQCEDLDIGGRTAKLAAYKHAPKEWEYVLYLDADTEPAEDISFIFETLAKGWEILICRDMAKYAVARFMLRADNHEESEATWELMGTDEVLQYNGGVFAFRRCERTAEFFRLWQTEWQRWAGRDQGALLRALYLHPMKLFVLSNQWNASDRYPDPIGKVAVWHHNIEARRWAGKVGDRLDSKKAWQMVDNWQAKHGEAAPKNKL